MDIYSAIIVVVPLIIPVSVVFGSIPFTLASCFWQTWNWDIRHRVGLNLFLASYRFKIPLTKVYGYALPFLAVMAFGVLLIAYVPYLTLWGLEESTGEPVDFFAEDPLEENVPAAPPMGLDPAELQRLLEEEGEDETITPPTPPKLDMDQVFQELEED